MGFFDSEKNVREYLKMAEGYDGKELIKILKTHVKRESSVLELGMGPGKDLDILKKAFKATGSDNSQVFLDLYKKNNPDVNVVLLDAVTLDIEKKFDCIYSNKVLHHLKKEDLAKSFHRQKQVVKKGGILFHSFWYGDKEEEFQGLRFIYYNEETIKKVIDNSFDLIEFKRYEEMEKNDSFYVVLKKKE
jgi:SAM-dependent methyltransferase